MMGERVRRGYCDGKSKGKKNYPFLQGYDFCINARTGV